MEPLQDMHAHARLLPAPKNDNCRQLCTFKLVLRSNLYDLFCLCTAFTYLL